MAAFAGVCRKFFPAVFAVALAVSFPSPLAADKGHPRGPAQPKGKAASQMPAGGHGDGAPGGGGPPHGGAPQGMNPMQAEGFRLVSELHCNACHYISKELEHGASHGGGHGAVAPNIAFLGEKFLPEWLFDFLQMPDTLRPWLKTRMPNYHLSEFETVALVRHIEADHRRGEAPPEAPPGAADEKALIAAGRKLASKDYLDCFSCHYQSGKKPSGKPEALAPDLALARGRLRPEWIRRWIRNPSRILPGTKMPTFFEDNESGPEDILRGDEGLQIEALVRYVLGLGKKRPVVISYAGAEKRYPSATRAAGFRVMNELNCAGCHDVGTMHERIEAATPLAYAGSRYYMPWVAEYLQRPHRIRKGAARMPDFSLTPKEAKAIAHYLMTLADPRVRSDRMPPAVSPQRASRGRALFVRLKCGACHVVNPNEKSQGAGRLDGPGLARAGLRLQPEHLVLWLSGKVTKSGSKLEMDAHPAVSKMKLPMAQLRDLAAYISSLR
ncbi:MAG: c-type cytochrome [bacterium]|nr:c-type cytochrome [bacterium]